MARNSVTTLPVAGEEWDGCTILDVRPERGVIIVQYIKTGLIGFRTDHPALNP